MIIKKYEITGEESYLRSMKSFSVYKTELMNTKIQSCFFKSDQIYNHCYCLFITQDMTKRFFYSQPCFLVFYENHSVIKIGEQGVNILKENCKKYGDDVLFEQLSNDEISKEGNVNFPKNSNNQFYIIKGFNQEFILDNNKVIQLNNEISLNYNDILLFYVQILIVILKKDMFRNKELSKIVLFFSNSKLSNNKINQIENVLINNNNETQDLIHISSILYKYHYFKIFDSFVIILINNDNIIVCDYDHNFNDTNGNSFSIIVEERKRVKILLSEINDDDNYLEKLIVQNLRKRFVLIYERKKIVILNEILNLLNNDYEIEDLKLKCFTKNTLVDDLIVQSFKNPNLHINSRKAHLSDNTSECSIFVKNNFKQFCNCVSTHCKNVNSEINKVQEIINRCNIDKMNEKEITECKQNIINIMNNCKNSMESFNYENQNTNYGIPNSIIKDLVSDEEDDDMQLVDPINDYEEDDDEDDEEDFQPPLKKRKLF